MLIALPAMGICILVDGQAFSTEHFSVAYRISHVRSLSDRRASIKPADFLLGYIVVAPLIEPPVPSRHESTCVCLPLPASSLPNRRHYPKIRISNVRHAAAVANPLAGRTRSLTGRTDTNTWFQLRPILPLLERKTGFETLTKPQQRAVRLQANIQPSSLPSPMITRYKIGHRADWPWQKYNAESKTNSW